MGLWLLGVLMVLLLGLVVSDVEVEAEWFFAWVRAARSSTISRNLGKPSDGVPSVVASTFLPLRAVGFEGSGGVFVFVALVLPRETRCSNRSNRRDSSADRVGLDVAIMVPMSVRYVNW